MAEVVGQRPVQRERPAQAGVSGETPQQLGHMVLLQGLWGRTGRARKDRAVEEMVVEKERCREVDEDKEKGTVVEEMVVEEREVETWGRW